MRRTGRASDSRFVPTRWSGSSTSPVPSSPTEQALWGSVENAAACFGLARFRAGWQDLHLLLTFFEKLHKRGDSIELKLPRELRGAVSQHAGARHYFSGLVHHKAGAVCQGNGAIIRGHDLRIDERRPLEHAA